ncbi:MAG: glycosyltransferase family 4 protein [Terriglobia bacterium]
MRIVHVDTGSQMRGGQQQILLLARGLARRGQEQTIVCPDGSPLAARAGQEGFRVFGLPEHDPGRAHGIVQLRQFLLGAAVDVLHAHDGHGQTIAWLASLGLDVRRLASRRVTFVPRQRWTYRLQYSRTCDAVIAISDYVRRLLLEAGVPDANIAVIPDGIEVPEVLAEGAVRACVRARWGFGAEEFVVGHLGASSQEKGQAVALEAAPILAGKCPQARLVLAGADPPRAEEAVPPNVRWLGYQEDVRGFFAGLDLYMMPSRHEGLGSSALLAMAHGLAVIATRVGGLPEIVAEGRTGWLIRPGSPLALAEAITDAASDPTVLAEFGRQARERARLFSSDMMVDRTVGLYRRLLEEGRRIVVLKTTSA